MQWTCLPPRLKTEKKGGDNFWEKHFSTSQHHFPLKNYIIHAFPLVKEFLAADTKSDIHILECGCGTGSTLIPLLLQYPETTTQFVGFDISASAIRHFASNPHVTDFLNSKRLNLFQHDITKSLHVQQDEDNHEAKRRKCEEAKENLLHVIGHNVPSMKGKMYDAIFLVFVLSAIPTVHKMVETLEQLCSVLKPEGVLFIRDYAFPDHNFFRFQEKNNTDNTLFFLKGDGTTQFFFDKEVLHKLADKAGMEETPEYPVTYHCNRIENRKNGKRMDKVFVNGTFRRKR
ncbi:hypothetical protein STCU_09739 [Strigomonas culicis]|uniref:tRNA N(3)-methylcytidine methyltransferase n=1 Tax=Strigomonas culicis TaxID=28005 RepID=S9V7E3_9TRYP|nr:hypothetical protein STCU_09739 [Strigomonas culicis]|eukprot:EPY18860.1 hypothetical protein STCU_09739 [Strigomonas culicis]